MNLKPRFIFFILIIFWTVLFSCKDSQTGLVNVTLPPSKYAAEYQKASILLQNNKPLEAISVYKDLCRIEDDSLKTYSYMALGSAYLISNDYQNAFESYNKSIRLNSKNAESYVGLGSISYKLQDYKKATTYYNLAKNINPNSSNSYWGLALSYDKLNINDSAKANAKRFIELEPDSKYRSAIEQILQK